MNGIWFTSDHHWGHANIIRFSNRPFATVEEMDEALVDRWNSVVRRGDTVYHLGDVSLHKDLHRARAILDRLNGSICLIRGNHESVAERLKDRFAWIKDYAELKVPDPDAPEGRRLIIMCHYAFRVWNKSHHGSWHLYGHSHANTRSPSNKQLALRSQSLFWEDETVARNLSAEPLHLSGRIVSSRECFLPSRLVLCRGV